MTGSLGKELYEARANLERLERAAAAATCREMGRHDWQSYGGANASCGHPGCGCSVPVNVCSRCGDCDYGDNAEAERTRRECAKRHEDDEGAPLSDAGSEKGQLDA